MPSQDRVRELGSLVLGGIAPGSGRKVSRSAIGAGLPIQVQADYV